MRHLIIYDQTGRVLAQFEGDPTPSEPVGVPFLWVDIPEKKYVESVDVSGEEHKVVFADYPATELDQLRIEMARGNSELFETMIMLTGGGF